VSLPMALPVTVALPMPAWRGLPVQCSSYSEPDSESAGLALLGSHNLNLNARLGVNHEDSGSESDSESACRTL
jgi:hypothetical protein